MASRCLLLNVSLSNGDPNGTLIAEIVSVFFNAVSCPFFLMMDWKTETNATGILHTLAPQAVGAEGDIDGNMEEADQEINTALV